MPVYSGILAALLRFNNPRKFVDPKGTCRPLGSVVEHSLHTRGVNGSNPLAGTKVFDLAQTYSHRISRNGLTNKTATDQSSPAIQLL